MKIINDFEVYKTVAAVATSEIAKSDIQFCYGTASPKNFYEQYDAVGYGQNAILRKVIAIPYVCTFGLVKTIYHLASALFVGIPQSIQGNRHSLTLSLYCIARDLQESCGWFVTIFSDKVGSYLVQEALFQKECYDIVANDIVKQAKYKVSKTIVNEVIYVDGVKIPKFNDALKITLCNFAEMGLEERQTVIEKFELQENIEVYGGEKFFEKLQIANRQSLEMVTIVDLKYPPDKSALTFALLPEAEFIQLKVEQIQGVSTRQRLFIKTKVHAYPDEPAKLPLPKTIGEMRLIEFVRTSAKAFGPFLNPYDEQFPVLLIKDYQLPDLDFTNIPAVQINQLFYYNANAKQRFSALSVQQVQSMLNKLGDYQLSLISTTQLKELDFSNMSADRLNKLFCYEANQKQRFEALSHQQVQSILNNLGDYQLSLISNAQLKELDFSNMVPDSLNKLFCYEANQKQRFEALRYQQVQTILNKLGEYQLSLISNIQLSELDFRSMPQDRLNKLFCYEPNQKMRFRALSSNQVQPLLDKLGEYQLSLISNTQLSELDFTSMSQDRLNKLFCYEPNQKNRFENLSSNQVQPLLNKLGDYQLSLISNAQLSELDLSSMPQDRVNKLFCYDPTQKQRMACVKDVKSIYHKLGDYQKSLLSETQCKTL